MLTIKIQMNGGTAMEVIDVTMSNFEQEVLKADKTVLVDIWAPWCGPCRQMSPIVDEIARENGNIKVCKANADEAPEVAMKYGVSSIPTLLVFKNGELVQTSVGLKPKSEILKLVE